MSDSKSVVETQELRIVDWEGRVRAKFGMFDVENQTVGLHLLRSDGSVAVQIDVRNEWVAGDSFLEYPYIRLIDTAGKQRLALNIGDADGQEMSRLSVCGSDGESKVTLVVPPDDYGEIPVKDYTGKTTFIQ